MTRLSFDKIKQIQKEVARRVQKEGLKLEDVKYVAGFEVAYASDKAIVGATVFDFKEMKVVERKHLVTKSPMNYIPGLNAFRAGPVICQLYFDLEYDADVLLIVGEGVSHESRCGTASFVGVELAKPTIGVAKNFEEKSMDSDDFLVDGKVVGRLVRTRPHARPVFVSVGNMIDLENSCAIVKSMIVFPHKMPEPLHIARKIAKKAMIEEREGKKEKKQEELLVNE